MSREIAENAASRWLLSREEPGWSLEDEAALEVWLDESPHHRAAFWRLEHGMKRLDCLDRPGSAVPRPSQRVMRRRWTGAGLAAAAVIALSLAIPAARFLHQPVAYTTAIGGREDLPLADGTHVKLNTATKLRARVTRTSRVVWLDRGEAYFEVAHDPAHPFVVHAGTKTITVLGTKFSVRRDGDRVQVAVLEGRVRVEDVALSPRSESSVIERGDIAFASAASTLVASSPEKVSDVLSWRNGRLNFHETTLADAVAEFNRYNRIKLIVADPRAAATRIGGTFGTENVGDFAALLRDAYGFRITDEGGSLTISSPS